MTRIACILCSAGLGWAQLSSPLIGYVRTTSNELRPVLGVTGAFVLGDALERDVLSAAFTSTTGLVKKDAEILFYRHGKLVSRHSAPSGRAAFRFTTKGEPASVRFENGECAEWSQQRFQPAATAASCADNPVIEQVGEDWFAVHTEQRVLLKRGDESWQLPE